MPVVLFAGPTVRRLAVTAVLLAGIGSATAACGPGHGMAGRHPAAGASVGAPGDPLSASKPVKLKIPSAEVDSGPLLELGLDDKRRLQPPPVDRAERAGWYTGSVTPGEKGVSVLLARFNTANGPALLHNMPLVKVGDRIEVRREDGRTAAFTVRTIQQVAKEKVTVQDLQDLKPSGQHAELRLVVSATNDKARYNMVFHADLTKSGPSAVR